MGAEQFSTPVRGAAGTPISVAQTGTIETDNYDEGGTIDLEAADYPATINPDAVVQELILTATGAAIVVDITTTSGTTLTDVPLNGRTLAIDTISMDSLTFKDPEGSGDAVEGLWVGE